MADGDGLPEAGHVSNCGHGAYVQIARVDHDSGAASSLGSALAVLDWDKPARSRVVDIAPLAAGTQSIAMHGRTDFDMPIDCCRKSLFVAEPKPLFSGGGRYEFVNLATSVASEYPFSNGAQVGGFAIVNDELGWRITHTGFGPGASSHRELVGAGVFDTYNTFSGDHVEDLAFDAAADLLFFPNPCVVRPANQNCKAGLHVFAAHTGARAVAAPIALRFAT